MELAPAERAGMAFAAMNALGQTVMSMCSGACSKDGYQNTRSGADCIHASVHSIELSNDICGDVEEHRGSHQGDQRRY